MMNTAIVNIWGKMAGAVAWDEKSGWASFEYDPAFKRLGWELSPLKMPLSPEQRIYSFPELRKETGSSFDTFKGLPGLLADMLPDRYGNELINLWLAQQGRPENSMNPIEMLYFIGKRGMGALEIEPAILKQNVNTFSVEIDSLVEIASKMLSKKEAFVANLKSEEEKAMRELKLTYAEAEQMFRRMVFNVIARNCDDHSKNFSFILKQGDRWRLAPAYDLCHAYRPGSEWVSRHALSVNGKRENITREDLIVIGRSIRNKKAEEIIDQVNDTVHNWNYYADKAGVDKDKKESIDKTLFSL